MDKIFIFYSLVGLLMAIGIVVLFTVFNNRKNKLLQRQLESDLSYQKRLHNLELNMLRDQMNPHFIHNSLNSIQYYIQRNEVEISENYLSKFSRLMRQFFEYSGKSTITLEEEIELLNNYLVLEKLRFEDKFEFQINIDPKLDLVETQIPPFMTQPLVENAINHGLFHKPGNGTISIDVLYLSELEFKISILDNGVGIKKSQEIEQSSKRGESKHSTDLLKERIDLLRQTKEFDIDFEIIDGQTGTTNKGTKASLTFKALPE